MKWLSGLLLAVLLVGVSACGGDNDAGSEGDSASQEQATGQDTGNEDLADVPDVVAEVNGTEIPREEFVQAYQLQLQQAASQAQASGQQLDQDKLKEQVAQSLVSTELLVQEADQRDITVSDSDVEQTLQGLASQNGSGSVEKFLDALKEQGMDRDEVDRQVRKQLKIERLVSDEAGPIKVTRQEARALYDQMRAQQSQQQGQQGGAGAQQLPPFAQVRTNLEAQVKSQKEQQVAQRLLGDLRDDADIVVNL